MFHLSLRTCVLLLALLAGAPATAQTPQLRSLSVEGADFRAALSDGTVLRGRDLIGASIDYARADGGTVKLHIVDAFADPRRPEGDVWLFDMRLPAADGGGASPCDPDPDGKRLVMPLASPTSPGGFTLTCTAGANGKCVRFGYRPWATTPAGVALAPFHAACTRMVRADYGGDGHGWTLTGTAIDLWDTLGIQQPETGDKVMPFEAGWKPDGAVCVAHPRVPANGDLAAVLEASPRLAATAGEAVCTEASARAMGAIVFNRSRLVPGR